MSAAMAIAHPAPMAVHDRHSPRYAPLAPAVSQAQHNSHSTPALNQENRALVISVERSPSDGKISPRGYGPSDLPAKTASADQVRSHTNNKAEIIVKTEPPSSPSRRVGPQNGRHRPRKLDLNTTTNIPAPLSSRPSAGASMQDVGLMCLSPGIMPHNDDMRQNIQRSISVRDQQRSIIEARLLKSATKSDHAEPPRIAGGSHPFVQPHPVSHKKRPPPGLSIVPPAAERFANERVIQSAPLGQTFTGRNSGHAAMREQPQPHIQHAPAIQTNNRLPPITDVLGSDALQPMAQRPPFLQTNSTPSIMNGPPLPSPGYPPQTAHPMSQSSHPFERPRDFRSAEEAVEKLTHGREELQPKLIRYGGRQPPTPPSPNQRQGEHLTPNKYRPSITLAPDSGAGRRRTRNEYEADSSPPLGSGPDRNMSDRVANFIGSFGQERDRHSPNTQAKKKEEFIYHISKAWDLFHS